MPFTKAEAYPHGNTKAVGMLRNRRTFLPDAPLARIRKMILDSITAVDTGNLSLLNCPLKIAVIGVVPQDDGETAIPVAMAFRQKGYTVSD